MSPFRRWFVRPRLAAACLVLVLLGTVAAIERGPILRRVGHWLVVDSQIQTADIIVVGAWADGAAVLEAADLVHAGVATRVAIFADPPDEVDQEFLRRGIPYEDAAARARRQLYALGVPSVELIGGDRGGTEAAGDVVSAWCATHHFATVVMVTTRDHSRRVNRVLQRAMRGQPTRVVVRGSRFSAYDPDTWWQSRDGVRAGLVELQKLLLDVLSHPLT